VPRQQNYETRWPANADDNGLASTKGRVTEMAWPDTGDCVMVVWEDVKADSGWRSPDEIDTTPATCVTLGYILNTESQRKNLIIASTIGDNGLVTDIGVIPISNVKHLYVLHRGEEVDWR
jgi:hypothetical protein